MRGEEREGRKERDKKERKREREREKPGFFFLWKHQRSCSFCDIF